MERIRGQLHPLQNPVVLEHLFKKLKLRELKECRLVCRAWRHASSAGMQSSAQITFQNPDESSDSNAPEEKSISNFHQLIAKKESTFHSAPFTKTFQIESGILDRPHFWRICGHAIKSLRLKWVTFLSAEAIRQVLFHSCPNLEKVVLIHVKVKGSDSFQAPAEYPWVAPNCQNWNLKSLEFDTKNETDLGLSWIEIFSHFPSLEDLKLHDSFNGRESLFRSLAVVRKHHSESWNLKKIAFSFFYGDDSVETMNLLLNSNLELEELKINFVESAKNGKNVQKVVTAHGSTLKTLFISVDKFSDPNALPIPRNALYENLTDFSFLSKKPNSNLVAFLASLPNLKKLTLSFLDNQQLAENLVFPNCKEFVAGDKRSISTDDIHRLKGWLPNLEKLEIGKLDNESFAKVCECWPNLVSLKMSSCFVNDAGISGFDESDVEKINEGGVEGHWRPITVPRANLASLKDLKELGWDAHDARVGLGHCSALFGILQLANLEYLNIRKYQVHGTMWLRLLSHFPHKHAHQRQY